MRGFVPAESFGPEVAARYDDEPRGDEAAAAAVLAELSGGGAALELAIGTGRIALPLAALGVRVDGIELSAAMVERLRAKPGGAELAVTLGDMVTTRLTQRYAVVYLVYNTIFNILTQDGQVDCFRNAAAHLASGGVFVIETAVPSAWIKGRTFVNVERLTTTEVGLDVNVYDPLTQRLDESHVSLTNAGIRLDPISCRLAWPSELDLMARLAGMTMRERWGGWDRSPFTADSTSHVSVWAIEE